ncbi:MAG: M3 family metallopeptidase [Rikenella sp.]|nr:M3 family metallopeptidase [Rikenella sp.]
MTLLCAATVATSCGAGPNAATDAENPFFTAWETPFGTPPFEQIRPEHYRPAFDEGMAREKAEIEAIVNNPEAPTFENTILAYDNSGEFLRRVSSVFGCVAGTDMTPELETIQGEVSPLLTRHNSDISRDPRLFARVKAVYEGRDSLCTDSLQRRLTEKMYNGFVRSGAELSAEDQARLREVDEQLAMLSIRFGRNLRGDNGAFALVIDNEADLKGLPQNVVEAAAQEAAQRGETGKWVFTLDKPSLIPFLQYAENRDLREQLYKGYLTRCHHGDERDNRTVLDSIANLRLQRANLLGYPTHAAYVLERQMAKTPEAVYALLNELWTPALDRARGELAEMRAIKLAETGDTTFASWDWWFYAERLRKAKYDLNEDELRPYFALDSVRNGVFGLATKLYGITFRERTDLPKYNPENRVFEVIDADGTTHLGVLYLDFHPRAGKRVGAWCTTFRSQAYDSTGARIAPVVSIVTNFSKPTADAPALLTPDETATFFHEFGHGLHQLFSMVPYRGLKGVERDFVELPSQVMENWAMQPEMLALYARHYLTGEPIPAELAAKIARSGLFNQGFATVEYLAASLLDMDYHTLAQTQPLDIDAFEATSMRGIGLIPQIEPRYKSTYFQHIFSGGYSSGYYSYIWAEVLDADAFDAYVRSGDLFNPEIAARFRTLLSRGGTADGDVLYRDFRGAEPSMEPLLRRRGLK